MELKAINFKDREDLFEQRTGKSFQNLYEKYYPKLVFFTNKICKDEQKAEDISTDSFMSAFEKIEMYHKEKSQFSTWLFTIARNMALQDLKSSKKTVSIDTEFDNEGTTLKDFLPVEEDMSYITNLNSRKAKIMMEYISELKEPYKKVIKMREIDRMSYKNIACLLGEDVKLQISVDSDNFELPEELSKVYNVWDSNGNEIFDYLVDLSDKKKSPFYKIIRLKQKGVYVISGRKPKNLSTVKSQIKNGRALLIKKTKREFDILDEMYL